MPRQKRVDEAGVIYHAINRSNARQPRMKKVSEDEKGVRYRFGGLGSPGVSGVFFAGSREAATSTLVPSPRAAFEIVPIELNRGQESGDRASLLGGNRRAQVVVASSMPPFSKNRRNRLMKLSDLSLTLEMHLAGNRSVFFVQVGSNDGVQGDPLHPLILRNRHWRGMFVEPVPFLFHRLVNNYQNADRFVFVNKAIGVEAGQQTLYYVAEEAKTRLSGNLPFWYDQLGSFNRDHILKHLNGKLTPFIVEQEVETQTLPGLLDEHGVSQVDLLHIDTEGFDEQVLSQFDFVKCKPSVVLFEHLHLSQEEKADAAALLRSNGYTLSVYGKDTLALLSDQAR